MKDSAIKAKAHLVNLFMYDDRKLIDVAERLDKYCHGCNLSRADREMLIDCLKLVKYLKRVSFIEIR